MKHSVHGVVALLFTLLASTATAWAQPQEPNFTQTPYVSNAAFNDATGMAWAPDGSNRLFIAMKAGAIRVIQGGALLSTPFHTETVLNWSEAGLIGICFDRAFTTGRPYLYAFMTISNTEQIIVRYNATGNTQTGRTVLVTGLPTTGDTHMGGAIGIGPDDKIYWAIGDNRVGPTGQGPGLLDTSTLQTKVGRANLDGSAPTDNPHYNAANGIGPTDYIWATGFRNPFTMTFHPVTGDLWLNVVGGGAEQVFLVRRNDHGGWPNWDGGAQPAGTSAAPYGVYIDPKSVNFNQPPVSIAFGSPTAGACITGGVFYNGSSFPATHRNNFFFGDLEGGQIVRSVLDASHTTITNTTFFATGLGQLVDIDVGPDGALYYVARTGGAVGRIQYTGTTPQNIMVSTNALGINEGSSGTFTVRLAVAPASNVTVNVTRTSGDADVTAAPSSLTFTPSTWNTPQTVTVSAATDADTINDGATITCSSAGLTSQNVAITVTDTTAVNGAPTATISQPVNGAVVSGATTEFFGNGTDPQGVGTLVRAEFFIDTFVTPVYVDNTPGGHYHIGGGHALWDTTTLSDGPHVLRMTVYDSGGLSGSHQITVTVNNNPGSALVFQQDPGASGTVSIEAENYDSKADRGDAWTFVTTPAGFSGAGALQALANDGTAYADAAANYAANSPQLDYRVNFLRAGTYVVWIRGNGPTGSDDSVHLGLDGAVVASAEGIDVAQGGGYVWSNMTMAPGTATITVSTGGVHVLNVWMREDGFILDKIVLTLNTGFAPAGNGPAQSSRVNDADFDGMPDTAESANGLNPAVADQDGDGVPDGRNDWNFNGVSNALDVAAGNPPGMPGAPPPPGGGGGSGGGGCGATGLEVVMLAGVLALRRRVRRYDTPQVAFAVRREAMTEVL